jgi:hypothetical protein
MSPSVNEAAPHHLPFFITAPGQTDVLLVIMAIVLVFSVLGIGVFFFWLHSLPERMVHNKVQFDIVAVLALLSLFTHIHAFWVAALLLALIRFPDFSSWDFRKPLNQMAVSLDRIATADGTAQYTKPAEDAQKIHSAETAINSDSAKQGS